MSFDANVAVATFSRALGNGQTALATMVEAFTAVSEMQHMDGTVIGRMIDRARQKGDDAAARGVSYYAGKVFPGISVVETKGKPSSVRTKKATLDAAALKTLTEAVADGVSLRSTKLKELFAEAKEPKAVEPEAEAKTEAASTPEVAQAQGPDSSAEETTPEVLTKEQVLAHVLALSDEDQAWITEAILAGRAALRAAA